MTRCGLCGNDPDHGLDVVISRRTSPWDGPRCAVPAALAAPPPRGRHHTARSARPPAEWTNVPLVFPEQNRYIQAVAHPVLPVE